MSRENSQSVSTLSAEQLAPRVLMAGETSDRTTAGISYLGGIALFNPALEEALSERERQCASRAIIGQSNSAIGRQLYIAEDTVKTHMRHIFSRTGVTTRVGLLEGFLDARPALMVMTRPIRAERLSFIHDDDWSMARLVARGLSNTEIAQRLRSNAGAVKRNLGDLAKRHQQSARELLASAVVLGGETGKRPPEEALIEATANYYRNYGRREGWIDDDIYARLQRLNMAA